jgi:hypothetical protein
VGETNLTGSNYTAQLWSTTNGTSGVLVASQAGSGTFTAGAWNWIAFSESLSAGVTYVADVVSPDLIQYEHNYWAPGGSQTSMTVGPVTVPDGTHALGAVQQPEISGGPGTFPTQYNNSWYGVDIQIDSEVSGGGGGDDGSTIVTVTADNGWQPIILKTWVITGGIESGGSYVVSGPYGTPEFSLTPAGSGSVIVEGIYSSQDTVTPAMAGSNAADDSGVPWMVGHYTGTVTAGSPVTLGGTDSDGWNDYAAYEVIPSGTAAIDASTPAAAVGTSSAAATATFTPPSGAVLVAIVLANGTAAQTFSVSDTLGLTWTGHGTHSGGYTGSSAVFTATVTGGGGGGTPPAVTARLLMASFI